MTTIPTLRSSELSRIHQERQSAVVATLMQECPEKLTHFCLLMLSHAPESFDDLRYGVIAAIAHRLHTGRHPISVLTVQEELAKSKTAQAVNLKEVFNFLALRPAPLTSGMLEYECEELWNAYTFRRQATLFNEAAQTLVANPSQADSIVKHVRSAIDELQNSQRNGDGLPPIIQSNSLLETDFRVPDLLIDGILHRGSKLSLGGGSKTFKSWTFLSMAIAISTGTDWLEFPTVRGKVLIVNFEIAGVWMRHRLEVMINHLGVRPEPGYLDFWNLRGYSAPHEEIMPKIIKRSKDEDYSLVIIDPSYKLMGGGDENSAADVGQMMQSFERLTVQTPAALAYGAHFAKGNAALKESIDRVSGSGVFARDPDSILTFTPHEQADCFTLEATLRNLPQLDPLVVEWKFPEFRRKTDLDPAKLKKRTGRPSRFNDDSVWSLLDKQPLSTTDWKNRAAEELGLSRSSFFNIKNSLESDGRVLLSKVNGLWTAVQPHQ